MEEDYQVVQPQMEQNGFIRPNQRKLSDTEQQDRLIVKWRCQINLTKGKSVGNKDNNVAHCTRISMEPSTFFRKSQDTYSAPTKAVAKHYSVNGAEQDYQYLSNTANSSTTTTSNLKTDILLTNTRIKKIQPFDLKIVGF